jgi:hypothetical protein
MITPPVCPNCGMLAAPGTLPADLEEGSGDWWCSSCLGQKVRQAREAGVPRLNPAQYSPEVIEVIAGLLRPGERIHDPFAGHGLRLGALCDRLHLAFTGTDLEDWQPRDGRVQSGDARDPATYPPEPFTVVTSPVYLNKRLADYRNGPTPTTKTKGRRDYGIALGRALHPDNLARHTGHQTRASAYWQGHAAAVCRWSERVVLNVDSPIEVGWCELLADQGYTVEQVIPARTRRYGGLDNADKRAEHEVVIVARRND